MQTCVRLLPALLMGALVHGSDAMPGVPSMAERILADRYLVHEGRPHGVRADWAREPRGGTTITSAIDSVNMWGQVYLGVDGDPNALPSLRVEIKDVRLLCLTSDGVWHLLHSSPNIQGADFREDFAANETTSTDRIVDAATGSWAVRLVPNRNFHFWSGGSNGGWTSTVPYESNGVTRIVAMASAYKARLVAADGVSPPNAGAVARANIVASCGGDCKNKDGSYGWDWGEGRFRRLTAQWQPVTLASASREILRTNPPPLYAVTDPDWNAPAPVPGWSSADIGFPESVPGVIASQNFDAAGYGSVVPGWRVVGGVDRSDQRITVTGTTPNGTPAAVFDTRGGSSPVAISIIGDTGATYKPGALYWMQFNLWKTWTPLPYVGQFSYAIYAGDPEQGGVLLGTGHVADGIDGYEAWRNVSWPLSLMTNPAVVVGTPKLFLKFTADAPTNTTDVGQILLDGIFLNELVPPPRASTTYDGATWTVTGEGTGIASTWDLLRLVGRHVSGDLTMVTRVVSMSDSGAAATAGLMVRENHAGGSPFVALQRTGAGGVVMRWRSSDGGAMQSIAASGPSGASTWLRLTRVGTSVTTSVSSDGQAWSTIGACNVTFATNPYLAGYVVSTSTSGVPNTVAFSNGFQAKPGDVNRDGMVDAADRDLLLGQFGLRSVDSSWDSRIDLNQDGRVDASDLGLVLRQLGH